MADISKITTLDGTTYNLKDAAVPAWAKAATKPSYTAAEVGAPTTTGTGASGTWGINITGHASLDLPLTGGTLTDSLTIQKNGLWIQGGSTAGSNNSRMTLTAGMPDAFPYNQSKRGVKIYSNAIALADPYNGNGNSDAGWLRHIEETANSGVLELAVGDDGNESIVVRQYNTSSAIIRTLTLLNASGNSDFPGQITSGGMITAGTYMLANTYVQAKAHMYLDSGHFQMKYNNTWYTPLYNHNNGNISVNAASSGLYLGYFNTTFINFMNSRAELRDGCLSLFPNNSSYREGLRIHSYGSWSDITLCGNDNTANSGTSANSWFIGNNNGNFYITRNGSSSGTTKLSCVDNVWAWNGTASGSINGNAATISNFQVSTTTNLGLEIATNTIGYVSGLTKGTWNYQQTDGAIYGQFYNANWKHEIYADYRTGQISVRGKNNGTWQAWRNIIDSTNWRTFIFANKNYTLSTLTVADSSWAVIPSGATDIFGLAFKDTALSADTGDWRMWLEKSGSATTLNMRIDGNIQATSFIGSLIGNAATATKATQDGNGATISSTYLKLSGGTVTGATTFTGGLRVRNNEYISQNSTLTIGNSSNNAITSSFVVLGFSMRDKNDYQPGECKMHAYSSGDIDVHLTARNKTTGNVEKYNEFTIGVRKNGTLYYSVSSAEAFRTAIGASASSDKRLKTIQGILPDVSSIKAYRFKWNDKKDNHDNFEHIGYLAQDIEKIAPYLIHDDENGYKTLDYISFLCAKINCLENRIRKLEEKISGGI